MSVSDPEGGGDIVAIASGGRVRIPIFRGTNSKEHFIISDGTLSLIDAGALDDFSDDSFVKRLITMYGTEVCTAQYDSLLGGLTFTVLGHSAKERESGVCIRSDQAYRRLGWVEGIARIGGLEEELIAFVHNGILYPIITGYETTDTPGEKCVDALCNREDVSLASLRQMIANPDRYFAYESTTGPWDSVESDLHRQSPLEVAALVIDNSDCGDINFEDYLVHYSVEL